MRVTDMRFDQSIIQGWIGKIFKKYKCDAFEFTNSVTQIVGLYIGDGVYALTNIQEPVDYYGETDDMAVSKLCFSEDGKIKSAFADVEMISTPINEVIKSVKLINEQQKISINDELIYEVWLTRAIIFEVGGREISFEKDTVPFSEEITIRRGYNLIEKVSDNDEFLQEWDEGYLPEYKRETIIIR